MAPLAERTEELLEGVSDEWRPFLSIPLLKKALAGIDAIGDTHRTSPKPEWIFNAFRDCHPSEIVATIIGQDPYPDSSHATGYCFSAWKAAGFPKSLQPIMDCLVKSGLIKERPPYGDLRPVAVQGWLLINAALTTREGATKAHVKLWEPFMNFFIEQLCKQTTSRFLLWGNVARDLVKTSAEKYKREIYHWSHPSPMSDNQQPPSKRFVNCDHFSRINKALGAAKRPPISWALNAPALAFTDGSCPKNGETGIERDAGFGVLIIGGHLGPTTIRGLVQPAAYALVDEKNPELGFEASGTMVNPSNNRGEILAFCWALLALLRGRVLGAIEIVSDSEACVVRMFLEYLPKRRLKRTAHQLENFDLIVVAEALLNALRAQADFVTITHTRAAHNRPCPSKLVANGPREACYWFGNKKADELAGTAAKEGIPLDIRSNIGVVRRLV